MKSRCKHSYRLLAGLLVPIFFLLAASIPPAHAQDKYEKYDVVVEVEGMFCPFCSYSIEKNLKKMKAIKQADVSLLDGVAKLILEKDQEVTQDQITEVVTDAGYKAGKFLKFPGEPVAETAESPE